VAGRSRWDAGERLCATKEALIAERMKILKRMLGVLRKQVRQRRSSFEMGHLRWGLLPFDIGCPLKSRWREWRIYCVL